MLRFLLFISISAMFCTCAPETQTLLHADVWQYSGRDSSGLFYDYHLSNETAYKYFEGNNKECIASGWIVCPYVAKGRIILQDDGKYRIVSVESKSAFEILPDTAVLLDWKEVDGVVHLSDNGVFLFNEIEARSKFYVK